MKVFSPVFKILVTISLAIFFLTSNCSLIRALFGSCDTEMAEYLFLNLSSYHLEVTYSDVECVLVEGSDDEDEDDEFKEERTYTTFKLHMGESRFVSAQIVAEGDIGYSTDEGGNVKSDIIYNKKTEMKEVIFRDR